MQQRQAFYDLIAFNISNTESPRGFLPKNYIRFFNAIKNVHFFDATAVVTARGTLGFIETHAGGAAVSDETKQLLLAINEKLFNANVRVWSDIMRASVLRVGPNERPKATAFAFDLQMIIFEQGLVEEVLRSSPLATPKVKSEINSATYLAAKANPLFSEAISWVEAAGYSGGFTSYQWRVAFARALLHQFHHMSQVQYRALMRRSPPPPEPPPLPDMQKGTVEHAPKPTISPASRVEDRPDHPLRPESAPKPELAPKREPTPKPEPAPRPEPAPKQQSIPAPARS